MIKNLAPDIQRKRLLLEGFFTVDVDEETIIEYFEEIAVKLNVHIYGRPIVFKTVDEADSENAGFDAFVPLFDSGISCYVWTKHKFLSVIIYTCRDFDTEIAVRFTGDYFKLAAIEWAVF